LELLKKTVGVKVLFHDPTVVAVGVANPLDLVLMPPSVCCMFLKNLLNFVVSLVQTGVECSWGCSIEWLDPLNVDSQPIPALPKSKQGQVYALVMQEYFTKWPKAITLKDATTKSVAGVLLLVISTIPIFLSPCVVLIGCCLAAVGLCGFECSWHVLHDLYTLGAVSVVELTIFINHHVIQ